MTHNTTEGAMRRAVRAIDQLPFVRGSAARMRVRD
jgi:hypothetical protein